MKGKMSFDSTRMKQFFIDHGEKFGFVVGLGLAGFVLYAGLKVTGYNEPPYGKTPEMLVQDVAAANRNLDERNEANRKRMNLPAAGIKPPDEKFVTTIDNRLVRPIDGARFGGIEWNRPLFDTKQRRTEPVYLAADDLRVGFHYGALSFAGSGTEGAAAGGGAAAVLGGGAGGNQGIVRGEEWVCVTGLIPIEAQAAAHRKAFQNALDPNRNAVPIYNTYVLQRAELAPGQTPDAVNWETAKTFDLAAERDAVVASWNKTAPEPAEAAFVKTPLTQPVPPVVDPILGDWAAHPPQILLTQTSANPAPGQPQPGQALPGQVPPGQQPSAAALPAYYLFRFFDFDVAPTKQYCYRLKLVLANPNYNLDLAHLEKPELAQGETRETGWSKPSPVVRIPILETLLTGDVGPLNGDSEPDGNVAVRLWLPNFGAQSFYQFEAKYRGAMLNNPNAEMFHRVPGADNALKEPFNLQTGAMLADFSFERGDARFKTSDGRPINRPAEALFLTSRGELTIHTQLMDWNQWEEFKGLVAAQAGGGAAGGGEQPRGPFAPLAPAAPAQPQPQPTGGGLKLQLK